MQPDVVVVAGPYDESKAIPGRIITIAPNSAEIICALGACDAIVGVSKYCVYPKELTSRPRVGGLFDPDLEKIIALRPDLVVLRGRSESVERLCTESGIPVYNDPTDTLAGIEQTIATLGQRLARREQADKLVERFRRRLAAIRTRFEGAKKPRVLVTISRHPGRLANILTSGKGTFLDEMITIAGGENAFGHLEMAYPQISPEAIIARRPDVILELMPEAELSEAARQGVIQDWKELSSVPAVASGRVFVLDDDNALIPSPRYVSIIEKVSRLLHPE
ncbi:MAG: ABC transporter substrate-binding protein [Planctomycetes bacterium]|nr:ABC transporter substrate-binding protein [Planctomycetota bacterium]